MKSSQNKTVNVGLIGAGAIGSFHGESIARRVHGAQLAAIADPVAGVAQRLADRLGCSNATTDAAQIIADPDIDAIIIAAPARFHSGLVVAAAEAGKAVFCEKPMALSAAEIDAGGQLAEGVFTAPPALALARQLAIDAPLIEAVNLVLAGEARIDKIVAGLMSRPLKREE